MILNSTKIKVIPTAYWYRYERYDEIYEEKTRETAHKWKVISCLFWKLSHLPISILEANTGATEVTLHPAKMTDGHVLVTNPLGQLSEATVTSWGSSVGGHLAHPIVDRLPRTQSTGFVWWGRSYGHGGECGIGTSFWISKSKKSMEKRMKRSSAAEQWKGEEEQALVNHPHHSHHSRHSHHSQHSHPARTVAPLTTRGHLHHYSNPKIYSAVRQHYFCVPANRSLYLDSLIPR